MALFGFAGVSIVAMLLTARLAGRARIGIMVMWAATAAYYLAVVP